MIGADGSILVSDQFKKSSNLSFNYFFKFEVHECVISVASNFLRFLVNKAKESKPEKIALDFRNYSKQILKVIFFSTTDDSKIFLVVF